MRVPLLLIALASGLTFAPLSSGEAQAAETYKKSTTGVRDFVLGATSVKVLIDSATLGGPEMEMARLTFPPNPDAPPRNHVHGRVEILYVLSGQLDHIVNGVSQVLKAGEAGIVRPGDQVAHRVPGPDSAKVLVIWAPGGELARIAPPRP